MQPLSTGARAAFKASLKTGAAASLPPSAAAPNFALDRRAIIDFFALTDENNLFS